jgi:malic enzyme
MDPGAIAIAVADPVPKVRPEEVHDDVAIIATGRADYPNQINTVLAFPSVFDRRVPRSVAQAVADDAVACGDGSADRLEPVHPPEAIDARSWDRSDTERGAAESVLNRMDAAACRRVRGVRQNAAVRVLGGCAPDTHRESILRSALGSPGSRYRG